MKERPVLFSRDMVRAILDGRKTQTRRVVKRVGGIGTVTNFQASDTPGYDFIMRDRNLLWNDFRLEGLVNRCPYGVPGDRLWVRETFQPLFADGISPHDTNHKTGKGFVVNYPSTDGICEFVDMEDRISTACKPSIHMPRWASRITLEVTDVRVERLQDITEDGARAEGIADGGCLSCGNNEPCGCDNPRPDARDAFGRLWMHINGDDSWHENPFVWVIEFKRVTP